MEAGNSIYHLLVMRKYPTRLYGALMTWALIPLAWGIFNILAIQIPPDSMGYALVAATAGSWAALAGKCNAGLLADCNRALHMFGQHHFTCVHQQFFGDHVFYCWGKFQDFAVAPGDFAPF